MGQRRVFGIGNGEGASMNETNEPQGMRHRIALVVQFIGAIILVVAFCAAVILLGAIIIDHYTHQPQPAASHTYERPAHWLCCHYNARGQAECKEPTNWYTPDGSGLPLFELGHMHYGDPWWTRAVGYYRVHIDNYHKVCGWHDPVAATPPSEPPYPGLPPGIEFGHSWPDPEYPGMVRCYRSFSGYSKYCRIVDVDTHTVCDFSWRPLNYHCEYRD
jgi:hypothetical protein